MNLVLWLIAGRLSLMFLLAGVMKAFLPVEKLKHQVRLYEGCAGSFRPLDWGRGSAGGHQAAAARRHGHCVLVDGGCSFRIGDPHAEPQPSFIARKEWSTIGGNAVLVLLAAFLMLGRWVLAPFQSKQLSSGYVP